MSSVWIKAGFEFSRNKLNQPIHSQQQRVSFLLVYWITLWNGNHSFTLQSVLHSLKPASIFSPSFLGLPAGLNSFFINHSEIIRPVYFTNFAIYLISIPLLNSGCFQFNELDWMSSIRIQLNKPELKRNWEIKWRNQQT